jgi:uncharacterized membrane protein YeaQ/YmgE (transglycosylase-associated protein family)
MTVESLIVFLLVGAVAGFIAAKLTRGAGLGVLLNMMVGVIGAFLGPWSLVTATLGAIVLLAVLGLFTRNTRWGNRSRLDF